MTESNDRAKAFIYIFIILIAIWVALTSTFGLQELIVGIVVSFTLSLALIGNYKKIGLPDITIKKIGFFIAYIFVLAKEVVMANFDVAYRVIHPKMPINPGIVIIKTELKQDLAKMILANSITLTPGTFTLDVSDDTLLIHWINVKTDKTDEATKIIGEKFERYLKVIFE
jgi:multicomponent Na+:H+ antiporter subunit E